MIFLALYIGFSLCIGVFLAMVCDMWEDGTTMSKITGFMACTVGFATVWPLILAATLMEVRR